MIEDLVWNVTMTALGAVVGWGLERLRRHLAQRKLERKYPVGGRFYSYYEDRDGDRKFVDKAMVDLKQTGAHLHGTTTTIGVRPRSWEVNAELIDGRYLSGIYYHESPSDPGRGTFFLEPELDGGFAGIWAGFDAVNREVTSGRYVWKRLTDIALKELDTTSPELDEAAYVLGAELGDRYVSRDTLVEIAADRDGVVLIAIEESGRVVGACTGRVLDDASVARYVSELRGAGVAAAAIGVGRVGELSMIAVRPEARGRGIASRLAKTCLTKLRDFGCIQAVSTSWIHDGDQSAGMLRAVGFADQCTVSDYWKESSLHGGYECPACGIPCRCSALLMACSL